MRIAVTGLLMEGRLAVKLRGIEASCGIEGVLRRIWSQVLVRGSVTH